MKVDVRKCSGLFVILRIELRVIGICVRRRKMMIDLRL